MALPKTRISIENFSEQKSWIGKLLDPINSALSAISALTNKNLTFSEHLAADILPLVTDGTFPLDVRWTDPRPPKAVWVGKARETSGVHTTITTALYVDWEMYDRSTLRINNIAGLTGASTTNPFNITLVAVIL